MIPVLYATRTQTYGIVQIWALVRLDYGGVQDIILQPPTFNGPGIIKR